MASSAMRLSILRICCKLVVFTLLAASKDRVRMESLRDPELVTLISLGVADPQ